MREIVGIFTHKELLEALELEPPRDRDEDLALRDRIIRAANEAKRVQRRLDKELELMVIEQLLRDDLALPPSGRPLRRGTIMGMQHKRVFVALDEFAIDLKIYVEDLSARYHCSYTMEPGALIPIGGSEAATAPTLRVGDAVDVRTLEWDPGRRRFLLEALAAEPA